MKSGKQRRLEIKEKRRKKVKSNTQIDVFAKLDKLPKGAIKSNLNSIYENPYNYYPPFVSYPDESQ